MNLLRAAIALAGFLTVIIAMIITALGWRLIEAWPPPSRNCE